MAYVRQRRYLVEDVTAAPSRSEATLVDLSCVDDDAQGLSLLIISSGHQRILRRRWRRSFRREGGKIFPETAFVFVFLSSVRLWVRQDVLVSP
jgi:hypothetical protein